MAFENVAPYEIIAAPFEVYYAPVGTSFPAFSADHAAVLSGGFSWIGTSGNLNITTQGVMVSHQQDINRIRMFGHPGPRKAVRTSEDLEIRFALADMTLEQYALALNFNTVNDEVGAKNVGLSRGLIPDTRALLVRGPSPYAANENLQYEVPIVFHAGSPEVSFTREDAADLEIVLAALVDESASSAEEYFGVLRAGDGTT